MCYKRRDEAWCFRLEGGQGAESAAFRGRRGLGAREALQQKADGEWDAHGEASKGVRVRVWREANRKGVSLVCLLMRTTVGLRQT